MKNIVDPDRFVTGTVGEPGSREFFIQATANPTAGGGTYCVGVEKEQASRLAKKLGELVTQLESYGALDEEIPAEPDLNPLASPVESDFQVGAMSIAYDEASHRFTVEFYPMGVDPEDIGEDDPPADGLAVVMTADVVRSFVHRTNSVVAAGRPPCPICLGPLDVSGHVCPRANGFRRSA